MYPFPSCARKKLLMRNIELRDQYREADGQRHLEDLFVGYLKF